MSGNILEKLEETEEKSREFSQKMRELKEIKKELREMLEEIKEDISDTEYERILEAINDGRYGESRNLLKKAYKDIALEFEDGEKESFANLFADSISKMEENIEKIRNRMTEIAKSGASKAEMINLIYGSTSLNKSDIRAVFDAIDKVSDIGMSDRNMARILSTFNRDLSITTTEKVLEEIRERGDPL